MPGGPDDMRVSRDLDEVCAEILERARAGERAIVEAAPEGVVVAPTPRSRAAERRRREFRARVDGLGAALGFSVAPDGTWASDSGTVVMTRVSERQVTLAAAAHFVEELCCRARACLPSRSVLFVVRNVADAEMFGVAVRQRRCCDTVQVVAIGELEALVARWSSGAIDAEQVVAAVTPAPVDDEDDPSGSLEPRGEQADGTVCGDR